MKFSHINLISKDWKKLAQFYIKVFNCKMILPQKNYSGNWLSGGTGLNNVKVQGAHLSLPGFDQNGPMLELLQYDKLLQSEKRSPNHTGIGNLSFRVESLEETIEKALQFGAEIQGKISSTHIEHIGQLSFIYLRDPEGNLIELQEYQLPSNKQQIAKEKNNTKSNQQKKSRKSAEQSKVPISDKYKSKRELLDDLQKDLDQAEQSLIHSKNEIALSKEKKVSNDLSPEENDMIEGIIPLKSKAEMVEELKNEMNLKSKDTKKSKEEKKVELKEAENANKKVKHKLDLYRVKRKLIVELKIGTNVKKINFRNVKLDITTAKLAQNLHAFNTMSLVDNIEDPVLMQIGKKFKADTVPLLKYYKKGKSKSDNEKEWALTPRFRDSLDHFLGKCAAQKETLSLLQLQVIELSNDDFISSYEALQKIVLHAEEKGAEYIRLHLD